MAALCVMSWAQAPAPAPTPGQAPTPAQAPEPTPIPTPTPTANPVPAREYPRIEFFAGGSYAEAGFFNAGHWAGLPGWDAWWRAANTSEPQKSLPQCRRRFPRARPSVPTAHPPSTPRLESTTFFLVRSLPAANGNAGRRLVS